MEKFKDTTREDACAIQHFSCSASFRGTVTREQLYIILEYIDDMKQRGFKMVKHDRTDDMLTGNVNIDYTLEKHVS